MILLDGPIGTELNARGVDTPLPHWSATAIENAPNLLASIHRDYANAGASIHTANTFRTSRRTVGPRWREWTNRAVSIARDAITSSNQVAGSLAPLEDCYRPDLSPGTASLEEHTEMAITLADAGCDLILCETFPNDDEAVAAVEAATKTGLPVWVALTGGPSNDLMTPTAMSEAAKKCVQAGAMAVLVNCTAASSTSRFLKALEKASLGVSIGAYANAGGVGEGMGWTRGNESECASQLYLTKVKEWVELGATIVGGCCGTGPEHIRAISQWLTSSDQLDDT